MKAKNLKARIDGIAVLDDRGNYIYLDQSFADLYGYGDYTELIGKSWRETFATSQVRRFEKEILPVLKEEKNWTGVLSGVNRDGGQFTQKVSAFYLEGGNIVILVKNIKQQERSVFKVGRPEYNWPEAIESPPDIVAIISLNYEIEKINSAGAEKLAMNAKEVEGKKCHEVVHRLTSPVSGCPCKRAIETNEAGIGEVTEDGTNYIVTAFPLFKEKNEPTAFLHTVTRATKSPRTELKACEFFVRELAKLKNRDEVYYFLLHSVREVLEPSKITIYKLDEEVLRCILQSGYRRNMVDDQLYLSRAGVRVEAITEIRSIYIPNVNSTDNFIRYDPEVNCEFVTPISSSTGKFGVLDIRKLENNSINPSERNLVEVMASEAGKALQKLPSN